MSRTFGQIRQIAFVVHDIEQAIHYWTATLGVGPFFMMRRVSPDNYRYKGKPSPPPLMSLAFANSGMLQVELIQQHDDHPSAYRDFLMAGKEGFQHVSAWVSRAEYDQIMEQMVSAGTIVLHEGALLDGSVRFAYFGTDTVSGGLIYEIADLVEPPLIPIIEMIEGAARNWDGKDPIRMLG